MGGRNKVQQKKVYNRFRKQRVSEIWILQKKHCPKQKQDISGSEIGGARPEMINNGKMNEDNNGENRPWERR